MESTVYIIEDDNSLKEELSELLRLQGLNAISCSDLTNATEDALEANPDCIVLDLKLPNTTGHAICKEIRKSSNVPIIILTSSESEFDEVMSMNLGADDYLTKPYSPAVLIAHIQSALRRSNSQRGSFKLEHSGVSLDLGSGEASFEGKQCELTKNEIKILKILMENPGVVITRQEIMANLWETDSFIDDNTLTVNINRLRKKLSSIGVNEEFISTRRGMGYSV